MAFQSGGKLMDQKNSDYEFYGVGIGYVRALKKYGIYITNNDLKIHGQPMNRRVAGRKGVRKNK